MEIQLWREILSPYEQAVTELVEKFQHLSLEHRERGLYSPIEQVTGRVKSITSILEKMKRKNIPFEEMEEQVEDIAGIRIICRQWICREFLYLAWICSAMNTPHAKHNTGIR